MKDALEIIIGKKQESFLSEYAKKVILELNNAKAKEDFSRWLTLFNIIVKKGKIYYDGTNELEITNALNKINDGFLNEPALQNYYINGSNIKEAEDMIENIFKSYTKKDGISNNKVYVKSTNKKAGTETGFASALLLALLTASIEISSIAYIISSSMD